MNNVIEHKLNISVIELRSPNDAHIELAKVGPAPTQNCSVIGKRK